MKIGSELTEESPNSFTLVDEFIVNLTMIIFMIIFCSSVIPLCTIITKIILEKMHYFHHFAKILDWLQYFDI